MLQDFLLDAFPDTILQSILFFLNKFICFFIMFSEVYIVFSLKGWWTGGFGYGLWIGVLVASGYSVVPVPSLLWKNEFKLTGDRSNKVHLIIYLLPKILTSSAELSMIFGKQIYCYLFALQDYSRELATTLFPSMSSLLKRKKDHG